MTISLLRLTLFVIKLEIDKYFIEVVDEANVNFVRKPDTDSIDYLVNKYHLDKENTYYIGDREIDISAAKNANIKSIYKQIR